MITYHHYIKILLNHIRDVQDNMVFMIPVLTGEVNEGHWADIFSPILSPLEGEIDVEEWIRRILNHDMSKVSSKELSGYRKAHQPDGSFDSHKLGDAWRHHYTLNDHHKEFWGGDILSMSKISFLEMLCDWEAMQTQYAPKHNRTPNEQTDFYLALMKDNQDLDDDTVELIRNSIYFIRSRRR